MGDGLSGDPAFWHWLILGVLFILLEVFAPGLVFVWLGVAGLLIGLVVAVFPEMAWQYQVLLFAGLALVSVVLGRRAMNRQAEPEDHPTLNRRGLQHVGKAYPLHTPIANGRGKIKAGDTFWQVTGPTLPAGTTVEVTGADGVTLTVKPASEDTPGA